MSKHRVLKNAIGVLINGEAEKGQRTTEHPVTKTGWLDIYVQLLIT